jgi:uncharacterized protein
VEIYLTPFLLGSLTGITLALTGAGGAILAVPLLIFGLHLTMVEAVPVALLAVCLSATMGAIIALVQGKVRYRAAALIAITGAIASPVGMWLAQQLPNAPLTLLFALILAYVAVDMLRQSLQDKKIINASNLPSQPCLIETADGRLIWTWVCARALALSGSVAGFLSGLLGVGGGFVVVPALKKVTNLQMQSILATSLAIVALISAIGVTSATLMGGMNWSIAIPFTVGALTGMLIGRVLVGHIDSSKLQQIFAFVAICISVGMVIKVVWVASAPTTLY